MSEEFQGHVEMRAADLERAGLSPAEALRQRRNRKPSPLTRLP